MDDADHAAGGGRRSRVIRGPGDDAAVIRARPVCVVSVDAVVEGTHFRLGPGWPGPAEIGRHAMAAALSDLAAMGAEPGEAYIVLALPEQFGEQRAVELVRGARALAAGCGVEIAGGDLVAASALSVSVTAVGWAEHEQALVARGGAREGDLIGVTGELGAAGAALALRDGRARSAGPGAEALVRGRQPAPRLREGRALAACGASAMIDLSDGLATDAGHIGRSSGVQLRVQLESLPLAPGVAEVAAALGRPGWELAAGSGEDYELCFCVPPARRAAAQEALAELGGAPLSWVGEVVAGSPGVALLGGRGEEVELRGFEHRW